ncbi:MAG: penicillin acylase family protein, partial [Alphaproteobacteria bacterium]
LGDLDYSLFMTSNGQSGNPLSGLHDTFVKPWSEGEYFTFSSQKRDAEISRTGKLTLKPE